MRTISAEHAERIDAVMAERDVGGLTAAIFEKDIHVTESLACLFAEPVNACASLIFCGGTSLSKGHGVIARMSEDIDIKVQLKGHLSGGQQTKVMNAFVHPSPLGRGAGGEGRNVNGTLRPEARSSSSFSRRACPEGSSGIANQETNKNSSQP